MNIRNILTKKNILILVGILAIAVIATILIIVISRKPSKDLINAVDTSWNAAKAEDQPAYLAKIDELSSYKLNSVEKEEDRHIIEATIIAPDLGSRLAQLDFSEFPKNNNIDDINAFLCEQIKKTQMKETTAVIYAYKINGEYHITFTDEFADAMSGGVYKYAQTALVEMLQKYEGGELK